jgi:hypothetical protein
MHILTAQHRLGRHRRRRLRMGGFSFTQRTMGLGGQASKRCGLVGACARGLDGRGWRGGGYASLGPGEVQHEEEPDEGQ